MMPANRELPKKFEDFAIVLEHLPYGHPRDTRPLYRREPIVQAVGEGFFTLLELIPVPGAPFQRREQIAIGKWGRQKIDHVKRRIDYDELTQNAKDELQSVVEDLVSKNQARFVGFFNNSGPVTTRMHSLELLPGIGKKAMWVLLEERKKGPFQSFEEIQSRTHIADPKKIIVKRIFMEIKNEDKYFIFCKPPMKKEI
jgi:putative nucleotide binding protein